MNFDFSEDQKFLGDQARKYLSEQCTTAEVRKVLNDDGMACHESLWSGIAEMGWLGTAIPEEYGGLGLGMLELCVLAEEIGPTPSPGEAENLCKGVLRGYLVQGSSRNPNARQGASTSGCSPCARRFAGQK